MSETTNEPKKRAKKEPTPQFVTVNGTVEDFITDGYSEIQSVGEEFREIYDNAPDNLKTTSVNEARDATACEIEGLSEPSVNSPLLGELQCTTQEDQGREYRGRRSQSRQCRASNGAAKLRAAADAIDEWLGNTGEAEVIESNENPGRWFYKIGGVQSDDTYDTEEDAKEACEEKLGTDIESHNEAVEEAEGLAQECEEIADTVENLEYPGMYG